MRTIIETKAVSEATYFNGCFLLPLKKPIDGKLYAVINYETVGKEKVKNLKTGNCLSADVEYKVGPEAILIKEIL